MKKLVIVLALVMGMVFLPAQSFNEQQVIASVTITTDGFSVSVASSYMNPRFCPKGICSVLEYSVYIYLTSCEVDTNFYRSMIRQMNIRLDELENDTLLENYGRKF